MRPMNVLQTVKELVRDDLVAVDAVIRASMKSAVPLVDQVAEHIIAGGGKRLRPLIVLLAARACGYRGSSHIDAAAFIEFIHTATLLHDDVVDGSERRRGRHTANSVYGNSASVLVGDFVYSRAFQMMAAIGSQRVMEIMSQATNVIAEGEVLQLMNMHDPDLAVEQYLRVIRYKTAKLFEASARLGALLGGASPQAEEACADFGRRLGTAFQLVDDLLDYEGDSQELGKNVGDDLREGKPTLPLLVAMERCTEAERELLRAAVRDGEVERLAEIIDVIRRTGALEATREAAQHEVDQARRDLDHLPQGRARAALLELSARVVKRSS
jgi:octaprenyl-diphosphate synthase